MLTHNKNTRLSARTSRTRSVSLLLLLVLLLSLSSCRRAPSRPPATRTPVPAPPDLSGCTRIEIRYLPSLLERGFHGRPREGILSPAELAHVRSLDPIVVEQKERIAAFAQEISTGLWRDMSRSFPGVAEMQTRGNVTTR
jgi:hypothetical protein